MLRNKQESKATEGSHYYLKGRRDNGGDFFNLVGARAMAETSWSEPAPQSERTRVIEKQSLLETPQEAEGKGQKEQTSLLLLLPSNYGQCLPI